MNKFFVFFFLEGNVKGKNLNFFFYDLIGSFWYWFVFIGDY